MNNAIALLCPTTRERDLVAHQASYGNPSTLIYSAPHQQDANKPGCIAPLNAMAIGCVTYHDYDILGFVGDDHYCRTHDWQERVVKAFSNGALVVCPNDLFATPRICTAVFLDARIVKALGWFAPPCLNHLFCDNFWRDLGDGLKAFRYLPDVVFEHCHPFAGKGEWTESCRNVNRPEAYRRDYLAYSKYISLDFQNDLRRVRGVLCL